MPDVTCAVGDPASVLLNLPDYRVLGASWVDGVREVIVAHNVDGIRCPACDVLSERVHQQKPQRVRDIPVAGPIVLWWLKRRFRCANPACDKATFTEHTPQVPPYARSTGRLVVALVEAVVVSKRSAAETARAHGVGWWTVQRAVSKVALTLPDPAARIVRRIGVDEHRFRRMRFFRQEDGSFKRVEPWMTCITNLDNGAVLGVIDGRDAQSLTDWFAARPRWWRHRVQAAAIDLHAPFRKVLQTQLPHAKVVADRFHLVQLANQMVTDVRRRLQTEQHGHRGRVGNKTWAHRLLLLRAGNTLSPAALAKLKTVFATDDPTGQLAAAWGVKEQFRAMVHAQDAAAARHARKLFQYYVIVADLPETETLVKTVNQWWPQILAAVTTGASNAMSENVNLGNKNIKRTGRGFRNKQHYRERILLTSAARLRAA